MTSNEDYAAFSVRAASAAIVKGHSDPKNLRELLIWTTSKTTSAIIADYFRKHLDDVSLLEALFSIAEEGEDCGDAPWAAANVLSDFPAAMLIPYKARLVILSNHQWSYLSTPAAQALAKIESIVT